MEHAYSITVSGDSIEEVEQRVLDVAAIVGVRQIGSTTAATASGATLSPVEVDQVAEDKTNNLWGRIGDDLKRVVHAMASKQKDGDDVTVTSVAGALGESEAVVRPWMSVLRRSLDATDRWWDKGEPMLVAAPFANGRVHYEFHPAVRDAILRRTPPK